MAAQGSATPFDNEIFAMKPIATFKSMFHGKTGTPRQPGICSEAVGSFTINKEVFTNPEHSLQNLQEFSHVWIIFIFHKNNNTYTKAKVNPPRLNGARVGLFSTRSPYRPNPIGLSLVKIERIEGATVHVTGADLIDGTPIIDIKPYIGDYDSPSESSNNSEPSHSVAEWVRRPPLEPLSVVFSSEADKFIEQCKSSLEFMKEPGELKNAIVKILTADPRSTYRRKKCADEFFYFTVDCVHVTCKFEANVAHVVVVKHMIKNSEGNLEDLDPNISNSEEIK